MGNLSAIIFPILYPIGLITGTIITRSLAKNNEWDISYKTAFYVIWIWMTIIIVTSYSIQIITGNLSFSANDNVITFSLYVIFLTISLSTFLIIGPITVKKFYEKEFRESFHMAVRILTYQNFLYLFFLPLFYI